MIGRICALGKALFPKRQLFLRSAGNARIIAVPGWVQVILLAAWLGSLGGATTLTFAYLHLHKTLHRRDADSSLAANSLTELRQQLADANQQYSEVSEQLEEAVKQLAANDSDSDRLSQAVGEAQARAQVLDRSRDDLEARLRATEQALSSKSGNLSLLSKSLAENRTELRNSELERTALEKKVQGLQSELESANKRSEQLKLALDGKQRELRGIAAERDRLRSQLGEPTAPDAVSAAPAAPGGARSAVPPGLLHESTSELEHLMASTGLDLDKLLARLGSAPAGQGGPYVALSGVKRASPQEESRIGKLLALAKILPLASPLAHYEFGSGFGPRTDPFNGHAAFHSGLDLDAPYRSPVYSTAPGVVVFAGVKGGYGRMVEISHGNGIDTRYAHLHRFLVAVGQRVAAHQEIGELGSTGRSTGPHLHYEVLVDGTALDPAKFLEAGKAVIEVSDK